MHVDHLARELNGIQDTLSVKLMENKLLQLSEFISHPTTCGWKLEHSILAAQGCDDSPIGIANGGHPVEKGLTSQNIIEDVHYLNTERFRHVVVLEDVIGRSSSLALSSREKGNWAHVVYA